MEMPNRKISIFPGLKGNVKENEFPLSLQGY